MNNMRSVSGQHYPTNLGVSGTGLGVGVERLGLAISSPAGKNNESLSLSLHLCKNEEGHHQVKKNLYYAQIKYSA